MTKKEKQTYAAPRMEVILKTLNRLMNALLVSALMALAAGCATDDTPTDDTPTDETPTDKPTETDKLITITASIAAGTNTRVAYDDDKAGSADNDALTWQAEDQLKVAGFGEANAYKGSEDYTLIAEDAGKLKASFTGTKITDATTFNVYYPATVGIDATTGAATLALGAQVQDGDNSTAHLRSNILLQATGVTDLSNVKLQMQSSIMKFALSGIPAAVGTLKTLTWSVETTNGTKSLELAFPQTGNNLVTFTNSQRTLTAYLAFLPGDMTLKAGGKFTVTLTGDKSCKAEMTSDAGKTYAAGLRYTAPIDGTDAAWIATSGNLPGVGNGGSAIHSSARSTLRSNSAGTSEIEDLIDDILTVEQ